MSGQTKFSHTQDGVDYFDFVCEGCKAEGVIGVPHSIGMQPCECPEGCGSIYVRWQFGATLALKCVVHPVYE